MSTIPRPLHHLLLVSDDPLSRVMLSSALARAGYRVWTCACDEGELAQSAQRSYDVVLLDSALSWDRELNLIAALRVHPQYRRCPVINVAKEELEASAIGRLFDAERDGLVDRIEQVVAAADLSAPPDPEPAASASSSWLAMRSGLSSGL